MNTRLSNENDFIWLMYCTLLSKYWHTRPVDRFHCLLSKPLNSSTPHPPRWHRWWDGPGAARNGLLATDPQTLRPRRQPLVPAGAQWMGGAVLPDCDPTGRVHGPLRAPEPQSRQYAPSASWASAAVRTIYWRTRPESVFRATTRNGSREGAEAGAGAWSQTEEGRSVVFSGEMEWGKQMREFALTFCLYVFQPQRNQKWCHHQHR